MNEHLDDAPDELEFDHLVDGELSDAKRQELLTRLDREPEGWRQCALAFLEAQAWRQTARDMVARDTVARDTAAREPAASQPAPARLRAWWPGGAGTLLAMAASFCLALTLGLLWRSREPQERGGPVAPGRSIAGQQLPSQDTESPVDPAQPQSQAVAADTLGTVTVKFEGQPETIEVPVMAIEHFDPAWLEGQPAPLSAELQRAFQSSGHRVEQYRQFVPVELEDGWKLVLPVDQVKVRYVGHQ